MKAAVRTRYGPPEVVRITDVDKPKVKDHEVLVKVHATTASRPGPADERTAAMMGPCA